MISNELHPKSSSLLTDHKLELLIFSRKFKANDLSDQKIIGKGKNYNNFLSAV